jgi:peroxin-14
MRQDMIHNAVLFLQDPKVQSSSLTSRIEFLEAKGLNEAEIEESLKRAKQQSAGSQSASSATPFSGGGFGWETQTQRPEPPRRDWRDLFVSPAAFGPLHGWQLT